MINFLINGVIKLIKTGLVSISFRNLTVEKIIEIVKKANLEGIEWGGDLHVPHGNFKRAKEVSIITEEAGLEVAAYGSYFRVGSDNQEISSFDEVLKTAVELNAPLVRVWAGDRGSEEADEAWWQKVIEKSKNIASMAADKDIKIAYEYHDGTLTDTDESASRLLKKVDHDNIYCYWQPPHKMDVVARRESLQEIVPWLAYIHVFYWESHERCPLSKGREDWLQYLKVASEISGLHYAMLEFVRDDQPEQFLEDAKVLNKIVRSV